MLSSSLEQSESASFISFRRSTVYLIAIRQYSPAIPPIISKPQAYCQVQYFTFTFLLYKLGGAPRSGRGDEGGNSRDEKKLTAESQDTNSKENDQKIDQMYTVFEEFGRTLSSIIRSFVLELQFPLFYSLMTYLLYSYVLLTSTPKAGAY